MWTPNRSARAHVAGAAGLIVASFLVVTPAQALDPTKALTQYVRDVWQTAHGLPQNSVNALVQTRDGFLWFGTQEGVVRFNGEHFEVFDRSNTKALRHNHISALIEDSSGALWIGTAGGGLTTLRVAALMTALHRAGAARAGGRAARPTGPDQATAAELAAAGVASIT